MTARIEVRSPTAGTVWAVVATVGAHVKAGDVIVILESMKMEIPVEADAPGVVTAIAVESGTIVGSGDVVAVLEREGS